MTSTTLDRPGSRRGGPRRGPRAAAPSRGLTPGAGLGLGVAVLWLSLLVLIPLAVVIGTAVSGGPQHFWTAVTNPQTVNAIGLTVGVALSTAAVNAVVGTLIAWVLVRDRFWGRSLINLVIDIPFALPTIVAGLVLLALYGKGGPLGLDVANTQAAVHLAIAFVTLPFVVRTVQPVLEELDADVEEAASSLGAGSLATFRRIILPSLVPAIAAGTAMSFARGISEYGSLVLLSGNLPNRTEVVSVRVLSHIENGDLASAAAIASGMLVIALVVLVGLDVLQRRVGRL